MLLPIFIAKRYLFAKKSHNVINIISIISTIGIAIGCIALVLILSIFNGFEDLIMAVRSDYTADLVIESKREKVFDYNTEPFIKVAQNSNVSAFCRVIEENIFIKYGEMESIATLKAIDSSFLRASNLSRSLIDGELNLYEGLTEQAIVSRSLAQRMGIRTRLIEEIKLYFPSRTSKISLTNPAKSIKNEALFPAAIVSIESSLDKNYLYTPIATAERLLEYDNETSYIEIYLNSGSNTALLKEDFQALLGDNFLIKDRDQQNETISKVVRSEKIAIYIILFFIILIISCNIFGALSMLIIDKRADINTFISMGAKRSLILKIFLF